MRAAFFSFAVLVLLPSVAAAQPQNDIRIKDFTSSGPNGVTLVKDPEAPVSFQLPNGWVLVDGYRWGDHETTLRIKEVYSNLIASFYYQYPLRTPRNPDPNVSFRGALQSKIRQRQREGAIDYRVRDASVLRRTVTGHPAQSFFADYTGKQGEPWTEYMLNVRGGDIKTLFFVSEPATVDLESFAKRLDAVAGTLDIPEDPQSGTPPHQ